MSTYTPSLEEVKSLAQDGNMIRTSTGVELFARIGGKGRAGGAL